MLDSMHDMDAGADEICWIEVWSRIALKIEFETTKAEWQIWNGLLLEFSMVAGFHSSDAEHDGRWNRDAGIPCEDGQNLMLDLRNKKAGTMICWLKINLEEEWTKSGFVKDGAISREQLGCWASDRNWQIWKQTQNSINKLERHEIYALFFVYITRGKAIEPVG